MKKLHILPVIFTALMLVAFANVFTVKAQDFNILINTTQCLEVDLATGQVLIATCDESSQGQRFKVVQKVGTAFVNIQTFDKECLEIDSANLTNGTDVTEFRCDGNPEQAFRLRSGLIPTSTGTPITGQITFSHSGKCFDTRNSPRVQQFPCDSSSTTRQTFRIKPAKTISLNSIFVAKWDNAVTKRLPLPIGQVTLTDATSFCSTGCDRSEPIENKSTLLIEGWTQKLQKSPQMETEAKAIKPILLFDYCRSGAVQKNLNMEVKIMDRNRNNGFAHTVEYTITPSDCKTVAVVPTPTPTPFGPTPTPTPVITVKPTPTPVSPTGGTTSIEQQLWDLVKNSTDAEDFQLYLNDYPSGKYASLARLHISRINRKKGIGGGGGIVRPTPKPTPTKPVNTGGTTIEDRYWNRIQGSMRASDYEGYLKQYPNGKYKVLAELEIKRNPSTQTLDQKHWDRIKNSQKLVDYQGYLSAFPTGKNKVAAQKKIKQLEQEKEVADFLRNAQFGSLSEISSFRSVFISTTDRNSRSRIITALRKRAPSLRIVGNRSSANFFIEYKLTRTMHCDPGTSTAVNACEVHTGRMWVHTIRPGTSGNVNRILWTATKRKQYGNTGVNFLDKNPAAQAGNALGDELKRMNF